MQASLTRKVVVEVRSVKDGKLIDRKQETVTESMDAVQKGGYPHFMLKEIHEQAP